MTYITQLINSNEYRNLRVSKIIVDKIANKGGVTKKTSTNVNAFLVDREGILLGHLFGGDRPTYGFSF